MLADSGLPKTFWADAAATACYLINRSPSTALNFKVPEYMWTGYQPSYSHLRPFGCIGYVHVNQGKLNPRSIKWIFLGYPSGVKGYKLWLVDENKCVISRDLIFNEFCFYKSNVKSY